MNDNNSVDESIEDEGGGVVNDNLLSDEEVNTSDVLERNIEQGIEGCQNEEQEQLLRAKRRLNSPTETIEITDADGFIRVETRRSKKFARSLSQTQNSQQTEENKNDPEELVEISLTSKTVLPKPISMAKLLRSQSITNIQKIKHKNPYKVLLSFGSRMEADKLMNCEKIKELGYQCQFTFDTNLSYGIVKQIEQEITKEEIKEVFKCEQEILFVKRLKRMTNEGWIDSESVRFCFKTATLPSYVYAYGCRFKVEPYIFPVTQCSGCWKYGHIQRSCPINHVICPKCGEKHTNCETTRYKCVNCKGPHMALNKNCPTFLKEKEIRLIMSQDSCTYKKALQQYLQKKKDFINEDIIIHSENGQLPISNQTPYKDALTSNSSPQYEENTEIIKVPSSKNLCTSPIISRTTQNRAVFNKTQKQQQEKTFDKTHDINEEVEMQIEVEKTGEHTRIKDSSSFRKRLLQKAKEIFLSDLSISDMMRNLFKLAVTECRLYFKKTMREGEFFDRFISYFIDG